MRNSHRRGLALVALIVVAVIAWIATARPPKSTVTRQEHAINEIDIDLAAGTPMPPLPTAQPDGMSIVTVDQALARGLQGYHSGKPSPRAIAVRLLNHGIMNRLCGSKDLSMPEDELVWAMAYTQPGLNMKDVTGSFYDRQPPPLSLFQTPDPSQPTPTARQSPTPEPVAGMLIVFIAGQGFVHYWTGLFEADSDGTRCPTFDMIRALQSLPDRITPVPTVNFQPVDTMSVGDLLIGGITATDGISLPRVVEPATVEPPTPVARPMP